MGRGDGRSREVSADDAQDAGTRILHVDMDAFYAAVEVLDDPSLAGLPLIIGSPEGRSVVSSASYEARRYGVRAAMPVAQALRLCPSARTVEPHFDRYQAVSRQIMALFESVTPLVEPLSVDEAFLDVAGVRRLWGSPGQIGAMIRQRVQAEVGLSCSVGVAATKHVAKMASTVAKPNGMLIVADADTDAFLAPRSVGAMWGIGPKAVEALSSRGVRTIGELCEAPHGLLVRALGEAMATRAVQLARGEDPRDVQTTRVEKSISHEETFPVDVTDRAVLRAELLRLGDRVAARLRRAGCSAAGVAIKVRFADFTTLSRSQGLTEATATGQRIGEAALQLFDSIERRDPVRLVGVRAEKLREGTSSALALWDDDAEWRKLDEALDAAHARFGSAAVSRARHVGRSDGRGAAQHPRARGVDGVDGVDEGDPVR